MANTDLIALVPSMLSYSQVSTYAECGERYRLIRARGVKDSSWFASAAGSAVHTQTEIADLNRLDGQARPVPSFEDAFLLELARLEEKGQEVRPSGRKQEQRTWAGGPSKKDKDWWLHYGPQLLPLWNQFRDSSAWEILIVADPATGEQLPAIELEFVINFGDEQVIGYIDRVFYDPINDLIIIVDIKTGALPTGKLQVGDYKVGLQEIFGATADFGCYWKPFQPRRSQTKPDPPLQWMTTNPTSLGLWNRAYAEGRYTMAREGIMAGIFLPNPGSHCRGCAVKQYCRAMGGVFADKFPNRELFVGKRPPKPDEIVENEGEEPTE